MSASPEVRYARSGDLRIAYQRFGTGDFDLLIAPGFISNLDQMWNLPPLRQMLEYLGSFARCVVFDKRGTGLSDRELGFGSMEERMDDLRAVLDDADVARAAVFGYSEGGPLGLLFAAAYPERVSMLAIYASMARVLAAPDYPNGWTPEAVDALLDWVEQRWGQGRVLRVFINNGPDDEVTNQLLARYERGAASPAMARLILRRNCEMDIRPVLPTIATPTLVLQSSDDPVVPAAFGRYLAEQIPHARYIERAGAFHMTWRPEEAWFVPEVQEFLTGHKPQAPEPDRFLATVLFTDIVESTAAAQRHGDAAWRRLLDEHDRVAADQVTRHGGRVVKTTGDGLLALHDSPSRAVACAVAICAAVIPLGVQIRAGVHTGEVEGRGDDVGGLGVHIGARIAALAGPGEVWVSRTVRDLTVGSGLTFADRGPHDLKGVVDHWELYSTEY